MPADRPTPRHWTLDNGCVALAVYLFTTLLMTFPLALSWRTALPAGDGDIWQNYWNLWWWKQCLLDGMNPFHTSYLFFPNGTDLVFQTHSPFNQVLSMPVNLLFGEAAAYNFCVMFGLTVSGFATYLLVREITSDAKAAFLAGLVFAYFQTSWSRPRSTSICSRFSSFPWHCSTCCDGAVRCGPSTR